VSTLTMLAPTIPNPADDRLRRTATGWALIGAPLLLLFGNVLSTPGDSESPARMVKLASAAGAEQVSIVLFLLGFTLFIPATFGLVAMIGRRGGTLATIGAWLAAIGLMAYAGLEATGVANIGLARSVPAPEAGHLVTAMSHVGDASVIFGLGLGLPVGLVLVMCAARRARLAPLWVPIVAALAFLVVMFAEGTLGGVVGDLLMLASLGYLGARLLRRAPQA
jgi:hypothetical protein